jgi:hypothetical protein
MARWILTKLRNWLILVIGLVIIGSGLLATSVVQLQSTSTTTTDQQQASSGKQSPAAKV